MVVSSMLINGDSASLPFQDNQFHCAVTSPPYWGLREYSGKQKRIWGGSRTCKHDWREHKQPPKGGRNLPDNMPNTGGNTTQQLVENPRFGVTTEFCNMCGAWYGALGHEPTPDLFIQHMVEIFREVRRVLRDDGVVWLNLGDSYSGSGKGAANYSGPISGKQKTNIGSMADGKGLPVYKDMQAGNLVLMPHRVAIALQDDGWIVRRDVIWWKRNPMPAPHVGHRWEKHRIKLSSADVDWKAKAEERDGVVDDAPHHISGGNTGFGDKKPKYVDCPGCEKCNDHDGLILKRGSWRHTSAHEYIFMLSKKMQYWSNQEAVRENLKHPDVSGIPFGGNKKAGGDNATYSGNEYNAGVGRNPRSVLDVPQYELDELWAMFLEQMTNPGDVLDVPTVSYKGAHYATYPPKLIAPLIRATCPRWACPVCGMGWSPVVEKGEITSRGGAGKHDVAIERHEIRKEHITRESIVHEYRPTCSHDHTIEEAVPGIVLDPFIGSGTTVMAANDLLRRGVGLDISMGYLDKQAKVRTKSGSPTKQLDDLPMFDDE